MKNTYQHRLYRSPINLPEGTSGRVSVKHAFLEGRVHIVMPREAFTRGIAPVYAQLKEPLRYHSLNEEGIGTWMTDMPCELNQVGEMLHLVKPRGRVLIGGLGLGVAAAAVANRAGVESVTVVEKSADVVRLCAQPFKFGYDVVTAPIEAYLLDGPPYDFYLLDTWQGTNEGTFWSTVLPLRRMIRKLYGRKPKIHCWAEDQMWGQVKVRLTTMKREQRHWYYEKLPLPMSSVQAEAFLSEAGTARWERAYGRLMVRP